MKTSSSSLIQQPCCHGAMGCDQNGFKLLWQCHPLLSGFLANRHLPRVSRQTHLTANDKGDNEMIPAAVHRTPDIYLTTEENSGNLKPWDCRWKLCDQSSSQWGPLSPNKVVSISQHNRKGEWRKGFNNLCSALDGCLHFTLSCASFSICSLSISQAPSFLSTQPPHLFVIFIFHRPSHLTLLVLIFLLYQVP